MSPGIGILIDRLNVGGVEKTAIQEVKHLNEAGYEATLLVLRRLPTTPATYSELLDGLPMLYLDDRLPRLLRLSWPLPFFAYFSLFHITYPFLMPLVVHTNEFQLILSHNSYTTFTAWSLSKVKRIPYVMFVWDPIKYIVEKAYPRGPIRWSLRLLKPVAMIVDATLLSAARCVVVSSPRHEQYLNAISRGKKKIVQAPPGAQFADQIPQRRMDYLLSATAWKAGKQIEVLLDVVAKITGAKLLVAGEWVDETYRNQIDSLIATLDLGDRVTILDTVSQSRLTELYRGARLSITLNAELGFGMPVLEAIANGSPVACTPSSGVAAYFSSDEAFYFEEGDRVKLKEIVETVMHDEQLAHAVGHRAWRRGRMILTWQAHAQVILQATQGAV